LNPLIKAVLTLVFSPTRFAIEQIKDRVNDKDRTIDIWNRSFRGILFLSVLGLYLAKTGAVVRDAPYYLGYFGLWLLPFSRVTELLLAFYQDAFQRVKSGVDDKEKRLKRLVFSYLEVAVQFGVLFFCFPGGFFKCDFSSVFEAIYFSVVTITTVGYGDFTPTRWESQFACMYELAVGFVLVIFALGSYLAASDPNVKKL
jgi:voltage-gated potassium channel